ncbi:hypothetical protein T12_16110, partial [Trichinella patagoniensis]
MPKKNQVVWRKFEAIHRDAKNGNLKYSGVVRSI